MNERHKVWGVSMLSVIDNRFVYATEVSEDWASDRKLLHIHWDIYFTTGELSNEYEYRHKLVGVAESSSFRNVPYFNNPFISLTDCFPQPTQHQVAPNSTAHLDIFRFLLNVSLLHRLYFA